MPQLNLQNLDLPKCPHCFVNKPNLFSIQRAETTNHTGKNKRFWNFYACRHCGGVVTAWAVAIDQNIQEMFPTPELVNEVIPNPARSYLLQCQSSLHAPSGAVMLAASAVDAMLKIKGYKDGSLYERIKKATEDHLITAEIEKWAHEVRLDANDQRHADEKAHLPDQNDAEKCLDFSLALSEYLFVLPSRVTRGIENTVKKSPQ